VALMAITPAKSSAKSSDNTKHLEEN
jgi:hypothetical protein